MAIIKPKRGSGAPSGLLQHELAVDTTNKRIYIGNGGGTGDLIGSAPGGSDTYVQFNNNGILDGTSELIFDGSNLQIGLQGDLRLGDADSSNYIGIQSPATVTTNNIYTLPASVGTANQVLQIASVAGNDATLQWATISSSGTPGGSDTYVQFNDGGSTFGGDAGLTYNKTTDSLTIAGDLAVNGADITTTATGTATVFNANATTLNMGGVATAITLGDATTATTTLRGGTLVGNTTTQNVFDTAATTVNAFGVATTLNIGYDGTSTNNTTNIAVSAISSGVTRTVNIGTGGLSGVANINIGYAGGGTTSLNSATIVGGSATQALFNTVATTVNFAGAATNLTMGATTGTTTTRNPTLIVGNSSGNGTIKTPGTGSLVLTTGTINSGGSSADITITGGSDGSGLVQINGGDLHLGQKVDADPTVYPVNIIFEGSTADGFETTLTLDDPTADRTITLPNASGTVITTGNLTSITSTGTISSGTWNGTAIGVAYGGTGTNNGNITGTGALSFTAGGSNTNINLIPNGTGSVDVASKKITNLATPELSTDAATKGYVDNIAQGLHQHSTVKAATTAKLETLAGVSVSYSSGTQAITWTGGTALTSTFTDGILFTTNATESSADRILVKNEGDSGGLGSQYNGVYYAYGSRELRRAVDGNTASDWAGGDFTFVAQGTLYNNTGWVQTETITTLDTDPILFEQFSGAGTYSADEITLTKSGSQFAIKSTYAGQSSITTLGTVTTGTWNATAIASDKGGTGLTTYTAGDLLYYSTGTSLSKLEIGTSGHVLTSSGSAPQWTSVTGTGDVVKATSPTLVTPNIGVATGTSLAATGTTDTLDVIASTDGVGLRIAQATSGAGSRQGGIRLGRSATSSLNTYIQNSSGVFSVFNGSSSTGTELLSLSTTESFIRVNTNITGSLSIWSENSIKLFDTNNSNYVAFKSPSVVTADVTWTLPATDGTNGQVLTTNGSATLSWSTPEQQVGSILSLYTQGVI